MNNQNFQKYKNIAARQLFKEKEFWVKQLSGNIEKGHFPYDCYHDSTATEVTSNTALFDITGKLWTRLIEITNGSFTKIHLVLTAGVAALMAKYVDYPEIIVGTSIERQDTQEPLINTILPLRIRLPEEMSFKTLLLEVKQTMNEAIRNQNFPVDTLSSEEEGLFDVIVLLDNIQERKYVEHLPITMGFFFRSTTEKVEGELVYSTTKYKDNSIKRIVRHFLQLLESALFNVDIPITEIELLSQEDIDVLTQFNNSDSPYPYQTPIHELIALQAQKTPDNIAIIEEESFSDLTYRQLNRRILLWAQFLLNQGVLPHSIIGIQMEPSIKQVCALLSILKTGSTYVPIDVQYPMERKSYMLKDSGTTFLITRRGLDADLKWKGKILYIEDFPQSEDTGPENNDGLGISVLPSDPAYVIYTSGSTGKPKGVMVGHRALVNYLWWAAKKYVKNETANFPFYTSPSFDLTVTSIYTPLLTGNTVYIYSSNTDFAAENVIAKNQVEVMKLTPVHLRLIEKNLKQIGTRSRIKRFIVGGEKLDTLLAKKIHDCFDGKIEIYNEYGPTEATVGCMLHKFNPAEDNGASVPVGVPGDNVRIYLLDCHGKNVLEGGIGELYIAGDGLAMGYLNRPELTAEKFIPNPFKPDKKIYKTGDMAQRLAKGNIEFLGRGDLQVKIRGYRVETGEVESCLLKYDGIHDAVVIARNGDSGYDYLAAYIVLSEELQRTGLDFQQLRDYMSGILPEFMIPTYFVPLDKLPQTIHGKIDRRVLPEPFFESKGSGCEYQPPENEMEQLIVNIWQKVFKNPKIGVLDNYFSLGGDSIKAIQLSSFLQECNLKVVIADLFSYQTIRELAKAVKKNDTVIPQGPVEGDVQLTPIQIWFFRLPFQKKHHFNQSLIFHRADGFDEPIVNATFVKLLQHHDALRMVFDMEGDQVKQFNRGIGTPLFDMPVHHIEDHSFKTIIEEKCNHIQSTIDLKNGPLVKLALFKTINGDYLFITIHHLVMDGVSWRIILEDIVSIYEQLLKGTDILAIHMPSKSTSFKEWSEKLSIYANSQKLLEEITYWKNIEGTQVVPFPKAKIPGHEKSKGPQTAALELSKEYTEQLLKKVHHAYKTEINDILLAALGLAITDCTGVEKAVIELEGHGREDIIPDINVSRTVGWFTSAFPVVLDIVNHYDLETVISKTKDMMRRIPSKGVGHGILKYLTAEENKGNMVFKIKPEIGFNYLGQFGEQVDNPFFGTANISTGTAICPEARSIYPIYINGWISNQKLKISVNYDTDVYDKKLISTLSEKYLERLQQLIDYCSGKKNTELTTSDFSAPMEDQEAEALFDLLGQISIDD